MDYYTQQQTENGNQIQGQYSAPGVLISDCTNSSAPRPSKRGVARASANTTSPPPQSTTPPSLQPAQLQEQQQHHTEVSQTSSPANEGGYYPQQGAVPQQTGTPTTSSPVSPTMMNAQMPPPQQQQELQSKVNTLMEQMNNVMTEYQGAQQQPQQQTLLEQQMAMMQTMMTQLQLMQQQVAQQQQQMPLQQTTQFNSMAPKPQRRAFASTEPRNPQMNFAQPQPQQARQQQENPYVHHPRGGPTNRFLPSHNNTSCIMCLVEFKRQRIKRYEATEFIEPGQYVICEGDRGTDCGFVIHCSVRNSDGSIARQESIDNVTVDMARVKPETGRVMRIATERDVGLLHGEIASDERIALKTCREYAERLGLNMEIVDCEFQFDRKKISFYFESPESVDFRELNTELYRTFGVRIWLENLNTKVKNSVPDGAISHADKMFFVERGLRITRGRK